MQGTCGVGMGIVCVLLAGACGGGGGEPTSTPSTITVNGRVLVRQGSDRWMPPAVGLSVVIEGHPEVVTNGAGEFTITDVARPYAVIILAQAQAGAVVYAGLTRADPVLQGPPPSASVPQGTTAQGQVTGGIGWPTPAGTETAVSFGNVARGLIDLTPAGRVAGLYDLPLTWFGGSPITVTAAAFQVQFGGDGVPTSYSGFGKAIIDAENGVPHFGVDMALEPVPVASTTGTVTIPAGYTACSALLEADLDAGPQFTIWLGTHPSGPISLLTPELPLTTHRLLFTSEAPTGENTLIGRVVQPGDTGLSLDLPVAARQLAPPHEATGVTASTMFEVTGHADRVYSVRYFAVPPTDGPYLYLTTSESSWTVPDLSAYGVTLPAAGTYEWSVEGLGPATVNDVCDDVPFKLRTSWYSTYAGFIEFTTAP